MRKTSKNIKLQALGPIEFVLLSIFLIALLAGCQEAPKFPTNRVWEVDIENQACGEYEIVDQASSTFALVKDWPLAKCQGVFGFSTDDMPKVLNWKSDMQTYAEKHCK